MNMEHIRTEGRGRTHAHTTNTCVCTLPFTCTCVYCMHRHIRNHGYEHSLMRLRKYSARGNTWTHKYTQTYLHKQAHHIRTAVHRWNRMPTDTQHQSFMGVHRYIYTYPHARGYHHANVFSHAHYQPRAHASHTRTLTHTHTTLIQRNHSTQISSIHPFLRFHLVFLSFFR